MPSWWCLRQSPLNASLRHPAHAPILLQDMIASVFASKDKYDRHCVVQRLPSQTLARHLDDFLVHRCRAVLLVVQFRFDLHFHLYRVAEVLLGGSPRIRWDANKQLPANQLKKLAQTAVISGYFEFSAGLLTQGTGVLNRGAQQSMALPGVSLAFPWILSLLCCTAGPLHVQPLRGQKKRHLKPNQILPRCSRYGLTSTAKAQATALRKGVEKYRDEDNTVKVFEMTLRNEVCFGQVIGASTQSNSRRYEHSLTW